MTIQLRLDTQALEALFPDGSQARVDLQQAVIGEFVRRHIKPTTMNESIRGEIERARADTLKAIKAAKDDAITQASAEHGIRKNNWNETELTPGAKAVIREAVRHAVRDEIDKAIREQIQTQTEKLGGTIAHDTQAAINRLINAEIAATVKARVAAVVEQLGKVAP